MSNSYFCFFFLVSFMISSSTAQSTLRPLALPRHSVIHCFINRRVPIFRLRLTSNSYHSPDFLRAAIEYELEPADASARPIVSSETHDLIKIPESCVQPLEFSTQNTPYKNLKLNISLFTGLNNETFAKFVYDVQPQHSQETVTLYSRDMQISMLARVSDSGQQPINPSSTLETEDLFMVLRNFRKSHNAICAITENSPPVLIHTNLHQNDFDSGVITSIEVVYRHSGNEKTVMFPAFACNRNRRERQSFEYIYDSTISSSSIRFYLVFHSYSTYDKIKIPFIPSHSRARDTFNVDGAFNGRRLFIIERMSYSIKCRDEREIINYVTHANSPYDARELRKGHVAHGFIGHMSLQRLPRASCEN